jgi:hypothetical protein
MGHASAGYACDGSVAGGGAAPSQGFIVVTVGPRVDNVGLQIAAYVPLRGWPALDMSNPPFKNRRKIRKPWDFYHLATRNFDRPSPERPWLLERARDLLKCRPAPDPAC